MTNKEIIKGLQAVNEHIGKYFNEGGAWMAEFIDNAIKALELMRWIPCSESLPEYGIEVVTVGKDGEYEINHIIDEEDGEWYWGKPIAWMPLSKPYKESDEE